MRNRDMSQMANYNQNVSSCSNCFCRCAKHNPYLVILNISTQLLIAGMPQFTRMHGRTPRIHCSCPTYSMNVRRASTGPVQNLLSSHVRRMAHGHYCQLVANVRGSEYPDSKLHGANMGSIWGRQDPGGPHVGPMNFAIWLISHSSASRCVLY